MVFPRQMRNIVVLLATAFAFLVCGVSPAAATEPSRLLRVKVYPRAGYSRIVFSVDGSPEVLASRLPGKRVRVVLRDTTAPRLRKWRSYSDANIGGIVFARRGSDLTATFATADAAPGLRFMNYVPGAVTVDVGSGVSFSRHPGVDPDRARIQSGAEKLVRDFHPPMKTDLSFGPTDRRILEKVIPEGEVQYFLDGEAALYKGRVTEAVEIFTFFAGKPSAIRALALYRLGEALYQRENYADALKAFRDAEKLWPEYLGINPSVKFYYAETLVRNNELEQARGMLKSLIREVVDKPNAQLLLVHLAELEGRMGREAEMLGIYRTVMTNFPGSKGATRAAMHLADREFLTTDRRSYGDLVEKYRTIYEGGGEFLVREEALFKEVLLKGMYAPSATALEGVIEYQKKYSRGMFLTVAAAMREDLVWCRYRDFGPKTECGELIALARDNTDFLSRCLAEDDFLPRVSACFGETKALRDEIALFVALSGKQWAAARLPFLYLKVVDDALELGDNNLADGMGKTFVQQFPAHPQALRVAEQLGRISYLKTDMEGVVTHLTWLLNKKSPAPQFPESYYYLGKALEKRDPPRGGLAMEYFISEAKKRGATFPYMTDAYLVAAAARSARGDNTNALALYTLALNGAASPQKDQILYKIGDICRVTGKIEQARSSWERLLKEGADPVWKRLAEQGLSDMEWKSRMNGLIGKGSK